jgi:hypothetical protein
MTQLVKLNARLGAAYKMQQYTATHFCFWKKPTMLRSHPHPLPDSKAVALLPRSDCPPAHGNSGGVALSEMAITIGPKAEFFRATDTVAPQGSLRQDGAKPSTPFPMSNFFSS